jgi:hypothetical protein
VNPELTSRIARPLGKNTVSSDWAGMVFLFKREYRDLGDPVLKKVGDRLLWVFLGFLLAFASFLAVFLLAGLGY